MDIKLTQAAQQYLAEAKTLDLDLDSEEDEPDKIVVYGPDYGNILIVSMLLEMAAKAAAENGVTLCCTISTYQVPGWLKEDLVSTFLSYHSSADLLVEGSEDVYDIFSEGTELNGEQAFKLLKDLTQIPFTTGDIQFTAIFVKP